MDGATQQTHLRNFCGYTLPPQHWTREQQTASNQHKTTSRTTCRVTHVRPKHSATRAGKSHSTQPSSTVWARPTDFAPNTSVTVGRATTNRQPRTFFQNRPPAASNHLCAPPKTRRRNGAGDNDQPTPDLLLPATTRSRPTNFVGPKTQYTPRPKMWKARGAQHQQHTTVPHHRCGRTHNRILPPTNRGTWRRATPNTAPRQTSHTQRRATNKHNVAPHTRQVQGEPRSPQRTRAGVPGQPRAHPTQHIAPKHDRGGGAPHNPAPHTRPQRRAQTRDDAPPHNTAARVDTTADTTAPSRTQAKQPTQLASQPAVRCRPTPNRHRETSNKRRWPTNHTLSPHNSVVGADTAPAQTHLTRRRDTQHVHATTAVYLRSAHQRTQHATTRARGNDPRPTRASCGTTKRPVANSNGHKNDHTDNESSGQTQKVIPPTQSKVTHDNSRGATNNLSALPPRTVPQTGAVGCQTTHAPPPGGHKPSSSAAAQSGTTFAQLPHRYRRNQPARGLCHKTEKAAPRRPSSTSTAAGGH